jgi:hypothetical protein
MPREPVLSRHRLPRIYRAGLAALWLAPVGLFSLSILLSHRFSPGVFDLRFLMCLLLMCLPALYIWHEGVDVLRGGLRVRVYWPRTYTYDDLDNWYFDSRADRRVLTVWNTNNRRVLECRAGHLTDLAALIRALKDHVRYRNWPE